MRAAGRSGRDSLLASARLVHGRWWRRFGFTTVVDVLAVLSGLVFDLASSLVYVLTVPLAAIARTLYYFDLELEGR